MIKSLVIAAALSIGLAGYAFAQNTITGAPAGTAPETRKGLAPKVTAAMRSRSGSRSLAARARAASTLDRAPAGTTPETPAPGTPLPIPGVAPTGSHSSQMRHRANTSRERARASAHHMHHMRHKPAPKPAT